MRDFKYLPDIWGAVAILGILLMLEMAIAITFYDAGVKFAYGDPRTSVIAVLANGIIFSVLMYMSGLSYKELFHPSTNKVSTTLLLVTMPMFLVLVASFWWLSDLVMFFESFFPKDEESYSALIRVMDSGLITIITICLVAPFLEEMLFRGIILRGFLSKYPATKAIILSSLLFSLMHFNIYQIPTAFVLGCFIGWLFYVTHSLWPSIIAHAINNAGAYIFYINNSETEYNHMTVNVFTFLVSLIGIYFLYRILRVNSKESV